MKELDDFSLEVKKIEEEAEEILRKADRDREKIIAQAKTDSVALIAKKQDEFEAKKQDKIDRAKQKIDAEKLKLVKEGEVDLKKLNAKCSKNVSTAVEYILERLDDKIEALK
jgi:V/A-type H+-transporting ATPase subunit G/H